MKVKKKGLEHTQIKMWRCSSIWVTGGSLTAIWPRLNTRSSTHLVETNRHHHHHNNNHHDPDIKESWHKYKEENYYLESQKGLYGLEECLRDRITTITIMMIAMSSMTTIWWWSWQPVRKVWDSQSLQSIDSTNCCRSLKLVHGWCSI